MPDDGDKPRSERCGNCRFWEDCEENGEGWCRRYPPTVPGTEGLAQASRNICQDGESTRGVFPVVGQSDWCGEWRAKGDENWRSLSVETSGVFSVRARKACRKIGAGTLGDLADRSAAELVVLKYIGLTTMTEIRSVLFRYGARLKGE